MTRKHLNHEGEALAVAETEGLAVVEAPAPTKPRKSDLPHKWRVHLAATTPLAHNPVEVVAHNAELARQEFCRLNGIARSDHAWSIEDLGEVTES